MFPYVCRAILFQIQDCTTIPCVNDTSSVANIWTSSVLLILSSFVPVCVYWAKRCAGNHRQLLIPLLHMLKTIPLRPQVAYSCIAIQRCFTTSIYLRKAAILKTNSNMISCMLAVRSILDWHVSLDTTPGSSKVESQSRRHSGHCERGYGKDRKHTRSGRLAWCTKLHIW